MKKHLKYTFLVVLLLCSTQWAQAQVIKGYVYELISSDPIWNATIKNSRTNETVNTAKNGAFNIPGKINDYLIISSAGYVTDTIFYYEDAVRRIYLNRDAKMLTIDEVIIKRLTDSRLAYEIAKAKNEGKAVDASQYQGGLRISPSRLFSKKAKEARANLALLEAEQQMRNVDRVFTTQLIASLTPLDQDEIALFRDRFRPSLDFIQTASPEALKAYISDSYQKFKK
ncbi:hypothetical protein [Sphingobacterium rhinopitheci]|uniref:hypothetical protein n=1 Tax=Sphingobacterium rhinopitheci TaxID=2781960 RepID=UPI001F52A94E|nr:hypothetical protein [Sphingobacterium rhinopitheci]MCI0921962.1 hypothetical protein [Sphingobacterium rhinopitheci]